MMSWRIVLEAVGILGGICTFLALMLGPMFYLGNKIENLRSDFKSDMDEMRKENKDFHGRLCAIEERNRK